MCIFPGAYLLYICALSNAAAGRIHTAYRCIQDSAAALEPVPVNNHTRAHLQHNVLTHMYLLHAVMRMQGSLASSEDDHSAQAMQDLILQQLQRQPHEARLYIALVLLYAAADSWDAAAVLLKTCLRMLPRWSDGSVMLG